MKKNNFMIDDQTPLTAEQRLAMQADVERLHHEQLQLRAKITQLNAVVEPLKRELRELANKESQLEEQRLAMESRLAEHKKLPYMGPRKSTKKAGKGKTPNDVMALFANMTPEQKAQLIAVLGG